MIENIIVLLLMFAVYAVLGWVTEVVFFALKTGEFVNRGFLNGPVCPLYGFGVVGVVILMSPVQDNTVLLFLGSMVFCTLIEFITGLVLKYLFHDTWWDYSEEPFNIGGYVCLRFSIMWGLACVGVIRLLHPAVSDVIAVTPRWLQIVFICIFYVYAAADLTVTVRGINKVNRALREIAESARNISDSAGNLIYEAAITVDEVKDRGEARTDAYIAFLSDSRLKKHRRLLKAFPTLRQSFKERLIDGAGEELRAQIEEYFEKRFKKGE